MRTDRTHPALRVLLAMVVYGAGIVYVLPLAVMALVSMVPADRATSGALGLVGKGAASAQAAADNYANVWNSPIADFPLYFHNSTVIAVLGVIGMTLSSSVVAYGFSRIRWPGRDAVFVVLIVTLMVPPTILNAPQYVLFKELGWIGTLKPLWLPAWFGGAFSIFLLRQFFLTIPRELDEAARMDGASHLSIFLRVIVPLSKPALATVALLQFVALWNDFQGPLLFLNHQDQTTLSLGLQQFHQQHGGTPWNLVMAASVLIVAPVMVLYVFARRFFVEGVAAGTLKE